MVARSIVRAFVTIVGIIGTASGAIVAVNGCTTSPWHSGFHCIPEGGPPKDNPLSCDEDDAGTAVEPLSCEAQGGECVEIGTSDFTHTAFLLWIGADGEQPSACPERANSEFYEGHGDLEVFVECQTCSCGPANCIMSEAMNVDADHFCQGANVTSYAAPPGWDGSCVSPSILAAGSFSSIKLNPATVSPCEPIGDPIQEPPGFAPGPKSFSNGVYWGKFAKGCQGAELPGDCTNTGDLCLPTSEPPPPGFRQCVQYTLPVDESALPTCPEAFPNQFVFYSGWKGNTECSACECGDPVGSQCNVSFSAYQDSACAGIPMPLFADVPTGTGFCADFGADSYPLASMQAKWTTKAPGTCEPSGGKMIGEVKGVDPRLFCCQEPPKPSSK